MLSAVTRMKLIDGTRQMSLLLADDGKLFNQHLLKQFQTDWHSLSAKKMAVPPSISKEHLLFHQVVAQTLGWLQDKDRDKLLPIYLRILLEAKDINNASIETQLTNTLRQSGVDKPRRLLGVIASLAIWSKIALPDTRSRGLLDLDQVQEIAVDGGRNLRWTTQAPLKMYALLQDSSFITPRTIFPPIGKAVSRGIETLFGFTLNESAKDYQLCRSLHLKMADLSGASIWDINSGIYRLGGGS